MMRAQKPIKEMIQLAIDRGFLEGYLSAACDSNTLENLNPPITELLATLMFYNHREDEIFKKYKGTFIYIEP